MLPGIMGMAGRARASLYIADKTVNGTNYAGYQLNTSGSVDTQTSLIGGMVATGEGWGGSGGGFECMASGSPDVGTTGTWLPLSSSQAWGVNNGNSTTLTVSIRPAGGSTEAQATIQLAA